MNTFSGIIPFENVVTLPRFQTKNGDHRIALERIIYLSAQVNYTLFHLDDGEQVLTSMPLSRYSALLENQGFIRLHKSYLLNLHYLHQCRIHHFLTLTLPTGQILDIARRKRTFVKKMVNEIV